jgi:hypothetical protein
VTQAGLLELDLARVRRWYQQRVPEHARSQVKVECDVTPRHLTIVECRPPWRQDMGAEWTRFPIARLRYTKATRQWSLYWRDRHLRFHLYDRITPSPRIDDLLREIDRDPTAHLLGIGSKPRHDQQDRRHAHRGMTGRSGTGLAWIIMQRVSATWSLVSPEKAVV